MEGPSMEWNIQEYSSEGDSSKVSWILNKGLSLGKKIVVTCIVVSSAPLVLPPLVVISALGFTFSVPFGLFFASYACTEKLMSTLLSTPTPSPMLEYGTVSTDEEISREGEEEDVGFEGEIDMEKEGEELKEEIKGGVEMRIELVGKGNEEVEEGKVSPGGDYGRGGVVKVEQEPREDADEISKEDGYEEDVSEYLDEEEEEEPLKEIDVTIEAMGEQEKVSNIEEEEEAVIEESRDEQPVDEVRRVVQVVVVRDEKTGGNVEEVKELVVLRRGVEEENGGEEDERRIKEIHGVAEEKEENIGSNVEEMENPSEDKNINNNVKLGKPIGGMGGRVEEKRDEGTPKENEEMKERRCEENVDIVPKKVRPVEEMEGISEGNRDEKNVDNIVEVEKPIEEPNGTINGKRLGGVGGGKIEGEQKPVVDKAMVHGGSAEDNIATDVHEDLDLEREKENVIQSNADAREIAAVYEIPEGNERFSDNRGDESVDFVELPVSAGVTESKHSGISSERDTITKPSNEVSDNIGDGSIYFVELPVSAGIPESKHAIISSEKNTTITKPSNEVLFNEEKIWEQINAMRTIVGYKAASHATCIDELKAIYIFTGVQPPASFKDSSDLVEVNNKLRFLMSIVGVK